jgi:chromosome segregation ATPase
MRAVVSIGVLAVISRADNAANKVTPIEKVMELMKKLSAQTEAEGKKEAEQYDKFACFCKEQADEKLYAIEKSTAKIAKQTARINKLEGEIADLNTAINALTGKIEAKEAEIKDAEDIRSAQHADYVEEDDKMQAAIKAIKGAIKALKDSKKSIKEGGGRVDLVQLRSYARSLKATRAVRVNAAIDQLQKPASFEYQSNDIIATLESLKDQFLENKKELDQEEFETNSAFERKRLGLQTEVKFATKEKDEKTAIMEGKNEEKANTEDDKAQEIKEKDADQNFLDELTSECEQKAADWDQRSKARAGELKALSEALNVLKEGASEQYGANKKLNLAQKATSFLQLRGTSAEALKVAATMRAEGLLSREAKILKSPILSVMSMKVKLAADHFVKVRGLIKDLIQKLEDDAEAEATQKGFCDKEMGDAVRSRDQANAALEVAVGNINKLTSEKDSLEKEVNDLKQAIADNLKSLNEATELRNSEKDENTVTVETATEGKEAVEMAIGVLNEFYNNAFIQTKYTPPNAGRDGETVGDKAPESFSGSYHGNQDAAKGIVGLLDVILSDFERTISATNDEESSAQSSFETYEQDIKDDNDEKDGDITKKKNRIADIRDELVDESEDKEDAITKKDEAKKELQKLKPLCVEGEETYAQRVAKREKEIEALKEAMTLLDEWQK